MWNKLSRDERIRIIRKGANAGLSSTQVAAQIGGVTRSAILGMADRNKIQFRSNKHGNSRSRPLRPITEPARPKKAKPATEGPTRVHITDHKEGQCRWPLWEHYPLRPIPREKLFYCGDATREKSSYCEHHFKQSIDLSRSRPKSQKPRAGRKWLPGAFA